jgi:predicted enzyme related to lactoylglutathione lyase
LIEQILSYKTLFFDTFTTIGYAFSPATNKSLHVTLVKICTSGGAVLTPARSGDTTFFDTFTTMGYAFSPAMNKSLHVTLVKICTSGGAVLTPARSGDTSRHR